MGVEATSSIKQYVVFQLHEEAYGLDIQSVQGIERMIKIAQIGRAHV